jgi:hypothetical protein
MRFRFLGALLAFAMVSAVAPVSAHHSIASEFNPTKRFTVTGVVTRLEWVNPHCYWYVDVTDKSGKVQGYRFQGGTPALYHRAGVRKDDWKIGEVVTVTAIAAKDDTELLGFAEVFKFADGHTIVLDHGEN